MAMLMKVFVTIVFVLVILFVLALIGRMAGMRRKAAKKEEALPLRYQQPEPPFTIPKDERSRMAIERLEQGIEEAEDEEIKQILREELERRRQELE